MSDEQMDEYLIQSDVFKSNDEQVNNEHYLTDSISFVVFNSNEDRNSKITTDEDGDLDVCRPELIDLTLGMK